MTQEDINEVMANSLKRYQLENLVFDGGNIESAKRLICLLQAENAQLKEQLRWRPVSEKPEKDGRYFAEVKPYTGCESTIITTAYFDGERFLWHDVVKWLPIPPAPEGEVK